MFSSSRVFSSTANNSLLNTFKTCNPTTRLHQQTFNRSFHASSANMTIKAYFDVTWNGPQVNVDASGKVTNTDGEVKSTSSLRNPSPRQTSIGLELTIYRRAIWPHQLRALRRRRPQDR